MSREVRRVPPDWQHPKKEDGRYQPMYDESFATEAQAWVDRCIAWHNGTDPDCAEHKADHPFFWMWDGDPPDPEYYRPEWTKEPTHYQMYETTSEGTPISPVFATSEELARWLADTGASAFAGMTASYEHWLKICRGGYAPSAVMVNGVMKSGVEFVGTEKDL